MKAAIGRWTRWGLLVAGVVLIFVTSCLREKVTWSRDGRMVLFTDGEGTTLHCWDGVEQRCQYLALNEKIRACHSLPGRQVAIVAGEESNYKLYAVDMAATTPTAVLVSDQVGLNIDASRSGTLFFLRPSKDSNEVWFFAQGNKRQVWAAELPLAFPALSPDERSLLLAIKSGVLQLDLASGEARQLMLDVPPSDDFLYWPRWLSKHEVIVIHKFGKDVGNLYRFDLQSGKTDLGLHNVYPFDPPAIERDCRWVAIGAVPGAAREDNEQNAPRQLVLHDFAANTDAWLTDETGWADCPVFSPDGRRLAYLAGNDNKTQLKIIDLKTRSTQTVWE